MSNESKLDLTPEEARVEVEAFMGEGWKTDAAQFPDGNKQLHAERGRVRLDVRARTYRAAVSALKQAWRDAVRPWCERGFSEGESHALDELNRKNDLEGAEVRAEVRMSRALGEDSNG